MRNTALCDGHSPGVETPAAEGFTTGLKISSTQLRDLMRALLPSGTTVWPGRKAGGSRSKEDGREDMKYFKMPRVTNVYLS